MLRTNLRCAKKQRKNGDVMTKKQLAIEVIERLKKQYPDAGCTLDYDEAIRERIEKEDISFYREQQKEVQPVLCKCKVRRYRRAKMSGLRQGRNRYDRRAVRNFGRRG